MEKPNHQQTLGGVHYRSERLQTVLRALLTVEAKGKKVNRHRSVRIFSFLQLFSWVYCHFERLKMVLPVLSELGKLRKRIEVCFIPFVTLTF